jgi:hypothetical protein
MDEKKIDVTKGGMTRGKRAIILTDSRPGNFNRPSAYEVGSDSNKVAIAAVGASVYELKSACFNDEFSHIYVHR